MDGYEVMNVIPSPILFLNLLGILIYFELLLVNLLFTCPVIKRAAPYSLCLFGMRLLKVIINSEINSVSFPIICFLFSC